MMALVYLYVYLLHTNVKYSEHRRNHLIIPAPPYRLDTRDATEML